MKPFVDQNMLTRFKTLIDYPKLANTLPNAPAMFINLNDIFYNLEIDKKKWSRLTVEAPFILSSLHAGLDLVFENGDQQVIVNVHVFTDTKQSIIFDDMLDIMSITSLPEVPFTYDAAGPGDLYFMLSNLPPSSGDSSAYTLFANFIIFVSTVDPEIDVRKFADAIVNKIAAKTDDSQKYVSPTTINPVLPKKDIYINEEFTIEVKPNDPANTIVDIDFDGLASDFEILVNSTEELRFKTLNSGDFIFPIQFLDVQTLYSGVVNVPITVIRKSP